jgi:hypothetical protein
MYKTVKSVLKYRLEIKKNDAFVIFYFKSYAASSQYMFFITDVLLHVYFQTQ